MGSVGRPVSRSAGHRRGGRGGHRADWAAAAQGDREWTGVDEVATRCSGSGSR
jgi:hypothetical protein